jgi:hypothetical protein
MGYVMHWLHTQKVDLTLPRDYYESLPTQLQQMLRCQVIDSLTTSGTETYIDFEY